MKVFFILSMLLLTLSAYAGQCGRFKVEIESCGEPVFNHSNNFSRVIDGLVEMEEMTQEEADEIQNEFILKPEFLEFLKKNVGRQISINYNDDCTQVQFSDLEGGTVEFEKGWELSKNGKFLVQKEKVDEFVFEELRNILRTKGRVHEEVGLKLKGKKQSISGYRQFKGRVSLLFIPLFLRESGQWRCKVKVK